MTTLFESKSTQRMSREDAATLLRDLADALARHNSVGVEQDGRRVTVAVPDEVSVEFEVEVGPDGSEIELEISW
ncbi:amphi-Trp domain-containing protein [Euzebya rosea]|uniref:amphi-Trp domain-containing protein n=1 Tax=Euzebya rosea TaxID=2052804 RepID=UPI0014736917|nr:amphi-Trp domain-containing protein [Euzebya rosea]